MIKDYFAYEKIDVDTLLCLLNQYKGMKLLFNGCDGLVFAAYDDYISIELSETYIDPSFNYSMQYELKDCNAFIYLQNNITTDDLVKLLLLCYNDEVIMMGESGLHIFIDDDTVILCDTGSETFAYYLDEYEHIA